VNVLVGIIKLITYNAVRTTVC